MSRFNIPAIDSAWGGIWVATTKIGIGNYTWERNEQLIDSSLWRQNEPSGDGICVEMRVDMDYRLNDLYCGDSNLVICEADPYC